jgi:hypothetical protein
MKGKAKPPKTPDVGGKDRGAANNSSEFVPGVSEADWDFLQGIDEVILCCSSFLLASEGCLHLWSCRKSRRGLAQQLPGAYFEATSVGLRSRYLLSNSRGDSPFLISRRPFSVHC